MDEHTTVSEVVTAPEQIAQPEAPKRKLVVDTGAYNRSTYLDRSGDEIYATRGIVKEIEKFKDSNPIGSHIRTVFALKERDPTDEDIATVKRFAALTGDLPFLSTNDISCIALTLRLQLESGDTSCIRTEPLPLKFANNDKKSEKVNSSSEQKKGKNKSKPKKKTEEPGVGFDCWITPENVHSYNISSTKTDEKQRVACMTTDFAMQNVLLHMGLNVITLDGFAAKGVRSWGQLCRACFEVYSNTSRQFCENCGNATVDRVPLTVDGQAGTVTVKDTRRWINTRGTIYTQPKPVTGKSTQMYIVAEDQLMMPRYRNQLRNMNKKSSAGDMLHFNPDDCKIGDGFSATTKKVPGVLRVPVGLGRGNPNSNKWMQKHKRLLKE